VTELQPTSALLDGSDLDRDQNEPVYYNGLSMETWIKVAILGALFMAVYWLVLRWLWDKTNPIYGEANWGHAICIPVVGLYYLYIHREELLKTPVQPNWAGLGVVLLGIAMLVYGIYPGQNQFFQGVAMVVALFGIVLLLCGWQIMTIAWFPIAYLVCAIPWPPLVYSYIASPLQTLAAKVAVLVLKFTGVNAFRTGTQINMGGITEPLRTLNVAEACAGLRSLMTFITVGAAVAFLSQRPLWQKIIITISAVPIAIFCNVMRVAGQGLLDHYVSRQLSESFAHQFVGLVMLIPAFFLILLVGWILDHVFIEEAEIRTSDAKNLAAARKVQQSAVAELPRRSLTPAVAAAALPVAKPPLDGARDRQAPSKVQPAKPAASPSVQKTVVPAKPAAPAIPPPPTTAIPRPASRPGVPPSVIPPRPGVATHPQPRRQVPPTPPTPKQGS